MAVLHREQSQMFPGMKCSEDWEFLCEDFRQGSRLQLSASNKWFSHERRRPFWLTHEHEKLTSCQRTGSFLTFWLWWTRGQWFCFLFCVRRYVPSVHWYLWELFEERRLLWKRKWLPYWHPHKCKLWPKMAQELNPHGGWKEWSRHNNTQKKSNGTLLIQLQHSP